MLAVALTALAAAFADELCALQPPTLSHKKAMKATSFFPCSNAAPLKVKSATPTGTMSLVKSAGMPLTLLDCKAAQACKRGARVAGKTIKKVGVRERGAVASIKFWLVPRQAAAKTQQAGWKLTLQLSLIVAEVSCFQSLGPILMTNCGWAMLQKSLIMTSDAQQVSFLIFAPQLVERSMGFG